MSITLSLCSFLFALLLKWSHNKSIDKKSNAICILENMCLFYLVCGSNFLRFGSTFCPNAQKKEEKN